MRKTWWVWVLALLLASPLSAGPRWGAGLGLSAPMGEFGSAVSPGLNLFGNAQFDFEVGSLVPRVELGLWGMNNNWAVRNLIGTVEILSSGMVTGFGLAADYRYAFPQKKVTPYALGGLNLRFISYPDVTYRQTYYQPWAPTVPLVVQTTIAGGTSTSLGLELGGGLEFELNNMDLFAEARITLFNGGQELPIVVGIHF